MAEAAPAWARGMVAALGRGDHRYVVHNAEPALEAAADQPGLLARVHTWLAQAHLGLGQHDAAREQVRLAIRAVKLADDAEGLAQIRGLRRRILAAIDAAEAGANADDAAPVAPPPEAEDPELSPALAALRAGQHELALERASQARQAARRRADPRTEVLALLVMARVPGHTEASLLAAREVADSVGDMNLVTAVTRAAAELDFDLGVRVF